ncbi:hypothetical protein ElyMa_001025900, partial [Elysia marginata]
VVTHQPATCYDSSFDSQKPGDGRFDMIIGQPVSLIYPLIFPPGLDFVFPEAVVVFLLLDMTAKKAKGRKL